MSRFALFAVLAGLAAASSHSLAAGDHETRQAVRPQPSHTPSAAPSSTQAVIDQYCISCHNGRTRAGSLDLGSVDVADVAGSAEVLEKVLRKVQAGMMPPPGRPRPDAGALSHFVATLATDLDLAARADPNPGRTETFHRLNRAEYRNAVKDMLAVDVDVRELLPPDDASYGFDNMAGVLRIDQSRLEQYLTAALKVSRAAVGTVGAVPTSTHYVVSNELSQYDRMEGLPFGTRGGGRFRHVFLHDAEYEFKVELKCQSDTDIKCDAGGGFLESHELEISIDGERIKMFTLEARPKRAGYQQEWDEVLKVRVPVKAGPHDVVATFVKSLPSFEYIGHGYRARLDKPYRYEFGPRVMKVYAPFVERLTIAGPFNAAGAGDTPSRRKVFICRPSAISQEPACAQSILENLARLAYRRPPLDAEVRDLLRFYSGRRAEGAGFEHGVETALQKLLVSPNFLFRIEREPTATSSRTVNVVEKPSPRTYRISDQDLASRLSFFLWSSIPDNELIVLASQAKLSEPAVLEKQVRRMLADDRAEALLKNFVGQWLEIRNIEAKRPSEVKFPNFDELLRQSMRRETELFLDNIRREDRNILELLTADYSFLNERLAGHYGITGVKGSHFRRVAYGLNSLRRGLLGHGSILTITSQPGRTSPVIRGTWLLRNILGTPPPDPPADVPPLKEQEEGSRGAVLSVRERMAEHRSNAVCASCHAMIDPLGLALEQFDATGQVREVDEAFAPIDASAVLPDGTKVNGVHELRQALLRRPSDFVTTMTAKMLTYALGRGTEYYDMPTVRNIVRNAASEDYHLSSLVMGIVNSPAFLMRRTVEPATRTAAAGR